MAAHKNPAAPAMATADLPRPTGQVTPAVPSGRKHNLRAQRSLPPNKFKGQAPAPGPPKVPTARHDILISRKPGPSNPATSSPNIPKAKRCSAACLQIRKQNNESDRVSPWGRSRWDAERSQASSSPSHDATAEPASSIPRAWTAGRQITILPPHPSISYQSKKSRLPAAISPSPPAAANRDHDWLMPIYYCARIDNVPRQTAEACFIPRFFAGKHRCQFSILQLKGFEPSYPRRPSFPRGNLGLRYKPPFGSGRKPLANTAIMTDVVIRQFMDLERD